jgi:Ca-activated chloride channel family protein
MFLATSLAYLSFAILFLSSSPWGGDKPAAVVGLNESLTVIAPQDSRPLLVSVDGREPLRRRPPVAPPQIVLQPFPRIAGEDPAWAGDDSLHAWESTLGRNWTQAPADRRWPSSGMVAEADNRAELRFLPTSLPAGLDPPRLRGFDWRFFLQHQEWPFVWLHDAAASQPAAVALTADPQLWISRVPLRVGTDSFELARRYLTEGELPPPLAIRKEEFLAAVPLPLAQPPRSTIGVEMLGGPSPFGEPGLSLLQVSLAAAGVPDGDRPATHLVLLVDVSRSMEWGGRLLLVRKALDQASQHLQPEDRLTLLAFNEAPQVLIESAGPEQVDRFRSHLAALSPLGATDPAAALRAAYEVVAHARLQDNLLREFRNQRIVLITDSASDWSGAWLPSLKQALATTRGYRLDVIDVGQEPSGPDPRLAELAQSGRGRLQRASTIDEIRAAVRESLTGRPQSVAHDATLTVSFNPKMVEAFRLIGHEAPRSAAGDSGGGVGQVTLLADQVCTALFELRLRPVVYEFGSDFGLLRSSVATALVTWRSPDGTPHRQVHEIGLLQFARSFEESPPPLQLAALVAETAELLRQSHYAQGSSLERVQALSRQLAPEVISPRAAGALFVRDFLELLNQAVVTSTQNK